MTVQSDGAVQHEVLVDLAPDEAFQIVLAGKARQQAFAVLKDPAHEVAGHTDVECAIWPIGHDIHRDGHTSDIRCAGALSLGRSAGQARG